MRIDTSSSTSFLNQVLKKKKKNKTDFEAEFAYRNILWINTCKGVKKADLYGRC